VHAQNVHPSLLRCLSAYACSAARSSESSLSSSSIFSTAMSMAVSPSLFLTSLLAPACILREYVYATRRNIDTIAGIWGRVCLAKTAREGTHTCVPMEHLCACIQALTHRHRNVFVPDASRVILECVMTMRGCMCRYTYMHTHLNTCIQTQTQFLTSLAALV
jgi:hypothetical protein